MSIDLLTPEFVAFAEEVKKLYAEKEQKVAAFKEIWLKHKSEIEALEQKAALLQQRLGSSTPPAAASPESSSDNSSPAVPEATSARRRSVKK